jgi:hypothetical protein
MASSCATTSPQTRSESAQAGSRFKTDDADLPLLYSGIQSRHKLDTINEAFTTIANGSVVFDALTGANTHKKPAIWPGLWEILEKI